MAAVLSAAPLAQPACASELDVLTTPTPTVGYVLDDAKILSKAAFGELTALAKELDESKGARVTVVTLRKLQFTTDVFEFGDKVIEHWYPSRELGDKKGVLLLVKGSKEGVLVTGPGLSKQLGTPLLDSISSENIPIFSEQEKFGEALISSLKRVSAKLDGAPDPGPPTVAAKVTGSNFKTKEQTEDKKGIYGFIVGGCVVGGGWRRSVLCVALTSFPHAQPAGHLLCGAHGAVFWIREQGQRLSGVNEGAIDTPPSLFLLAALAAGLFQL